MTPGVPPMPDRRAGHQGTEDACHQKLFAECQREHGKPLKEPPDARRFFGAKMNTAAHCPCQTRARRRLAKLLPLLGLGLVLVCARPASGANPPGPPAWQRELDAARLAEATAALARADKPADAEADRRLGELYRQLAAKYPGQAAVRKAAGDHFWRIGDTATATAEWQAAQTLDPDDAETASALGSAWLRDGSCQRRARAVPACRRRASRRSPATTSTWRTSCIFSGTSSLAPPLTRRGDGPARGAWGITGAPSELAADNLDFARGYAETFYGLPHPDWTEGFAAWDPRPRFHRVQPGFRQRPSGPGQSEVGKTRSGGGLPRCDSRPAVRADQSRSCAGRPNR